MKPDWYRTRGYAHFDLPVSKKYLNRILDPMFIASHAFHPFIRQIRVEKRYKLLAGGKREVVGKERPIAYASHGDSALYDYYKYILSPLYELALSKFGVSHCVLAYRKSKVPRSNIHFAKEVFDHIRSSSPCVAVALDIEDFFGSIPHKLVKQQWQQLLGLKSLPSDHYKVYRSLTKWTFVDRARLMDVLGRGKHAASRWPRRLPVCDSAAFRRVVVPIIETGFKAGGGGPLRGIPQGSPMSGLISNFAILEIDKAVSSAAHSHSVLYRRYSDDVMLVGSAEGVASVLNLLMTELTRQGLRVNGDKTLCVEFTRSASGATATKDLPLQYLGFTFDGQSSLIRSQTLARASRRMKKAVGSAKRAAKSNAIRGGSRKLRRQKLFARHSHLGPKRGSKVRHSNFYTYARRAEEILGSPRIRKQIRRQWPRLLAEIDKADKDG